MWKASYYYILLIVGCRCSSPFQFRDYGAFNICKSLQSKEHYHDGYCPIYLKNDDNAHPENHHGNIFDIWKSFPVDIFTNVTGISTECRRDYKMHLDGALGNEINSLKMFDATAKPSSGLLSGNINQYGDFDECLSIPNAQYCLALLDLSQIWRKPLSKYKNLIHSHFSIQETFDDPAHRVPGSTFVRWGFCLPKTCTGEDLVIALRIKMGAEAKVRPDMCQTNDNVLPVKKSFGDYFAIVYFVSLVAIVGIASLLYGKLDDDHVRGTLWLQILRQFAIQKNYKKLTNVCENKNEYQSVHGVRCLSAISLLMAHKTMASLYNPYINKTWMAENQSMKWSVIGRNAIIYTDCFLLISGLLNANALFEGLEKQQMMNFKEKLLNRLFRILPGLITVILFCTYILPFLGTGPLWPIVINHHSKLCKKYMWRNFIFVHNFYGFEQMCLTHTHQLGIDMQLFLVTPIFVYVLWRWKKMSLWITGLASAASMILRFYKTYFYNLSHVVHFGIPISRMFDTANHSYILPTHRATIYLIGVVLAWTLRTPTKPSFSKTQLFLIWSFIYIVGLTTWFAPASMCVRGYKYSNIEAAIYGSIYPFTWGAAVAWVIYSVENGLGSWFTPILTWKYFQIFARISYGVYLIQFPVFFFNVGITRHVGEWKNYMMLPPVETSFIMIFAALLTLFVEMPFQSIYKILACRFKYYDVQKEMINK